MLKQVFLVDLADAFLGGTSDCEFYNLTERNSPYNAAAVNTTRCKAFQRRFELKYRYADGVTIVTRAGARVYTGGRRDYTVTIFPWRTLPRRRTS